MKLALGAMVAVAGLSAETLIINNYAVAEHTDSHKDSRTSLDNIKLNTQILYKTENTLSNLETVLMKSFDSVPKYGDTEKATMFVRNATFEAKAYDTALTIGIISFMDECFYDGQSIRYNTRNNGINTLVQTTYDGAFLSKKFNVLDGDLRIKLGYGGYNFSSPIVPKEYMLMKENKGSHGSFLLMDHITENNRFELNNYSINIHFYDENIADLSLFGVSDVYTDQDSGIDVYGSYAVSYLDKRSGEWSDKLMSSRGINSYAPILYPQLFNFREESGKGWSYLVGISKEFDTDERSYKIGYEHYYASKNFLNLVGPDSGKMWNYDNKGTGDRLFVSTHITPKVGMTFCVGRFEREYGTKIGGLLGENVPGTYTLPNNNKIDHTTGLTIFYKF